MTVLRVAPWLIAALLSCGVALWVTADASSGALASSPAEARAFDQLVAVAAAHGHTIAEGFETYAHFGDTEIAHAPLDGIAGYTAADFQAGVLIMAIVITEPKPGPVPNGAYVVQVKFDPGSETGVATYFDARGAAVARVPAHARSPGAINRMFPGAYDPAPPPGIPNITSTHVWYNHHYTVDCAGWDPYRVIYY